MNITENYWQDVRKYFSGTYITLPEVAANHLFYVDSVGADGMKISDLSTKDGSVEQGMIQFTGIPYELKSPLLTRRQYYQNEHKAYLISRIPARMWKKGIHAENTTIQALNSAGLGGNVFSTTNLKRFVEAPESFLTKLEHLEEYSSVALGPTWAMVVQKEGAAGILYALTHPVGYVSVTKNVVSILKEFSKLPLPECFNLYKVVCV